MPNSFRIVYSSKVYRFKEIANLDVVNEETDYQKVPRTSLSDIVTGNSCEDRQGFTVIMREGEVQDFLAFPRLAAQIDLMVAEPENVVVQELGPFDRSIRTFVLHCATPVKIMDVTSPDEGNYCIGLMLWTVKRISIKN